MPLLLDLEGTPEACCNHHLDLMAKAMAESPAGDDAALWQPHQNPYLTSHVEDVTRRFQRLLELLQDALARLMTGQPIGELKKALDVPWERWDEQAFARAEARLKAKPPEEYTLDDWMLAVDVLIQRYLPDGVIESEAQYLTVRAALLGKVQANMENRPAPNFAELEALGRALPYTVRGAVEYLNPVERATLDVANAKAAVHIKGLTERARAGMKTMIIQHAESLILGKRDGDPAILRSRLFDTFGTLNRDFRRIAVTEAGECTNQGYVAATPIGARLRRLEAYRGACPFCKSIDGKVFTVVAPDKPDKNGETEVWLGKTNVGRSAASKKRAGGAMQERGEDEMWWPAAGVQHPNCRGAWATTSEGAVLPDGVTAKGSAKIQALIDKLMPVPKLPEEMAQ